MKLAVTHRLHRGSLLTRQVHVIITIQHHLLLRTRQSRGKYSARNTKQGIPTKGQLRSQPLKILPTEQIRATFTALYRDPPSHGTVSHLQQRCN